MLRRAADAVVLLFGALDSFVCVQVLAVSLMHGRVLAHRWPWFAGEVMLLATCAPSSYFVVLWVLSRSPQSVGAVVAVRLPPPNKTYQMYAIYI